MRKTILLFGILIFALLSLFQLSKYSVLAGDTSVELVIAIMAVIFFFIGIFISRRSNSNKLEKTTEVDSEKIKELQISSREYEVLREIVKGASNKEIADTLFVSESTVKTHVSNILLKLNAKRRTHAIQIAKELNILPQF